MNWFEKARKTVAEDKKSCTIRLISITKGLKVKKGNKKAIQTPVQDRFTIGEFKASRTSEFENKSSLNLGRGTFTALGEGPRG